jgi:hypothetical protein
MFDPLHGLKIKKPMQPSKVVLILHPMTQKTTLLKKIVPILNERQNKTEEIISNSC